MEFCKIPKLFFAETLAGSSTAPRSITVNVFSPQKVLDYTKEKIRRREGFAVATINLDHVVKLSEDDAFFQAYKEHDVIVADGFPIVWLGRMMGANITRTTGADLVEPMMRLLEAENKSLALIGTTNAVLKAVRAKLKIAFPNLNVVFAASPVFGFNPRSPQASDLMQQVEASGASVCFLAFGAPKQEILAARAKTVAPHVGFLSIGAALDFIAGSQVRAPGWVQRINAEWLWRLVHNPQRLLVRYAQCAAVFPVLLARSLWMRHISTASTKRKCA